MSHSIAWLIVGALFIIAIRVAMFVWYVIYFEIWFHYIALADLELTI